MVVHYVSNSEPASAHQLIVFAKMNMLLSFLTPLEDLYLQPHI